MRAVLVCMLATVACGKVKDDSPMPGTDATSGTPDSPMACVDPTSVNSCGESCRVCPSGNDRENATCDGRDCGLACKGSAPTCSDGSCSRFSWAFDSNMVDGIVPRMPSNLALAVRNHLGSPALAIDVTTNAQIAISIPICLGGTFDLRNKTFRFNIFFEGGNTSGEQYYVQASVPSPMTGAYIGNRGVTAGMNVPFTGMTNGSQFSAAAAEITIQAGSFGAAFAGTIWFDDIKLE